MFFREEDMAIMCSCNRYEQYGLLCSHVFCVLKVCEIEVFPKNYVKRRWTREVVNINSYRNVVIDQGITQNVDVIQGALRDIRIGHDYIINKLVINIEELKKYGDKVKEDMVKADEVCGVSQPPTKKDRIANLLGFNQPSEATIRVPVGIRTKGSGSKKRFKSISELVAAGKHPRKPPACQVSEHVADTPIGKPRTCHVCGKPGHNRRTCPELNPNNNKN